jgi:hypothetical protein
MEALLCSMIELVEQHEMQSNNTSQRCHGGILPRAIGGSVGKVSSWLFWVVWDFVSEGYGKNIMVLTCVPTDLLLSLQLLSSWHASSQLHNEARDSDWIVLCHQLGQMAHTNCWRSWQLTRCQSEIPHSLIHHVWECLWQKCAAIEIELIKQINWQHIIILYSSFDLASVLSSTWPSTFQIFTNGHNKEAKQHMWRQ